MLFEKIALEPDEKVLKVVRKHWFVIVSELIGTVFTAILPLVFIAVIVSSDTVKAVLPILGSTESYPLLTFGVGIWMLLSIMTGFMIWTHYYLDLWVITDRRIIAVDQIHFFNRNVAIFRLERLQDIEFNIKGLLPTFLNFGTLSAQTAGHHDQNFSSPGMPNPRELQSIIQRAMDERLRVLHILPDESE